MIVPDVNLLVYAYDAHAPENPAAHDWLMGLMNGAASVGLAWIAVLGFVRVSTNPRICKRPLDLRDATSHVQSWLDLPHTVLIHPGERHAELLFSLLAAAGTAGNLTTDAHLAALAIEYQAELHSTDSDMARFPGLNWVNPLA